MYRSLIVGGSLLLVGLTACMPKTALHTEGESAAIRGAEESGAYEVPLASLHLQYAKEELAAATALHADGKKDEAASMLSRAEADAELAVVLSRESAEKVDAEAAVERVRALRRENQ